MFTISFYEDEKGRCAFRDFLQMLHDTGNSAFYKAAAFLDYLEEKGTSPDRPVCKPFGSTIYMHCIEDFIRAAGEHKEVCVILYGQYSVDSFVLLHHFFSEQIPRIVPPGQMCQAAGKLRKHLRARGCLS